MELQYRGFACQEVYYHLIAHSNMNGTASLANRDSGRVLRANQQKVVFSGAAKSANDAAIAHYFGVLKRVFLRDKDSLKGWTQPVFNGFIMSQRWQSAIEKNCGRIQA
jgi:hypothetical protein